LIKEYLGLPKLHGSARLPVLDSHRGQVSALVTGLCRPVADLANGPHGAVNGIRFGGAAVTSLANT
jgi:hypothetical protein